ncbi:hypothetical protein B566_EDAN002511 [Ephemera danica]|nr:hypothetical protein B566_EDAN002511 [Ephemera danica]
MADTSSMTKPGSSGRSQPQAEPGPAVDDEVFDMNNNDPNNNTEFNDQPEVIEEIEEEEVNKAEDIQFKLLTEARAIHGVLNRYSIDEIYSYLEASIDHPQRMQFVMNGFLTRDIAEGDNANNPADEVQVIEPTAPKRISNSTNSEDSPVTKKEKLIELDDTTSLSPGTDNGRDVDSPVDLDVSVYSIGSSDDEANIPAEIPQEPIVIPEADANNANDNVCKEQITYLKELFPKMDSKMLEDRYMAVFPIEGDNSLNILVVQMLDFQEADIPLVADVPAPVVPDIIEVPQDRPGPSTVPISPEQTVIKKPTDANLPGPSSSKGPGPSTSGGLLPNSKTNTVPSSSKDPCPSTSKDSGPSTSKDPGPSTSKDPGPGTSRDPDPAGGIDESWDEPDGDTVSVDPEIQEQMSYLMAVLPNADPTFLEEKCKEFKDNNAAMEAFITDAMENKNYPTLADFNKREEVNKDLKRFTGRLSVKDFLELFPDPETTFKNKDHKNDHEYIERTMFYLLGRFRNVAKNSITNSIKRNNNLTKVVEELSRGVSVMYLKKLRPVAKEPEHLKDCKHLVFLQEVNVL